MGGDKAVARTLPELTPVGEYFDPAVRILRGNGSATVLTGGKKGVLVADAVGGVAWLDQDARVLSKWAAGTTPVSTLALSPDEQLALVGLESGMVGVFRLPGGEQVASWPAHTERVTAACWLGPREIATGAIDRTVSLWRVESNQPVRLFTIPTVAAVRDLALVAGGGLAVLETGSRAATIIDLPAILKELNAHSIGVSLATPTLPADAVTPFWEKATRPDVNGLRADYFVHPKNAPDELAFRLTRTEPELAFTLGDATPHPAVPSDWFRVCYRGWIKAPKAGQYTLLIDVDDEARVYLDGRQVGDRVYRGRGEIPLTLTDQPQRLRIDYSEEFGQASLRVRWSRPGGFAERPLDTALFHDRAAAAGSMVPDPDEKPK